MRDLVSDLAPALLFAPGVLTADPTALTIDTAGYDGATILLAIGAGGITFTGVNKIEFVLRHGDASDGSDQAPVTNANHVIGATLAAGGIFRALTAAKAAADVTKIGYKGPKRYISVLPDFSGTHATGTAIAGIAALGFPLNGPIA
jgi:hypothetical protein